MILHNTPFTFIPFVYMLRLFSFIQCQKIKCVATSHGIEKKVHNNLNFPSRSLTFAIFTFLIIRSEEMSLIETIDHVCNRPLIINLDVSFKKICSDFWFFISLKLNEIDGFTKNEFTIGEKLRSSFCTLDNIQWIGKHY